MSGVLLSRKECTVYGLMLCQFLTKSICVYHHGDHTCPAKPVAQKPVREIKQQLTENPRLTPSTIQSNLIVPQMRQGIKIALFSSAM